jgi:hypothetical protein
VSTKTEHRMFPPIGRVLTFEKQVGPLSDSLQLAAALTPSLHYPRTRITLCFRERTDSLTVHQAAQLRDQLDAAIAEAIAACPELTSPDDDELSERGGERPRG